MSAAQPPVPTTDPDPHWAAATVPTAIGRVLSVVRRLIDYGRQLAGTVQNRAAAPGFPLFAIPFGTADLAAILARITNGLRRAAALEAALCRRAARGRDLTPSPVRLPAARGPRLALQSAPPDALPEPQPADPTQGPIQDPTGDPTGDPIGDPRLARLPTEEEIAAEVRRRPVGAVIADICRDLGIMPGHLDRAFWDELSHAIIAYGGNPTCFLPKLNRPLFAPGAGDHADPPGPGWPAALRRLPTPATGPP